MRVQPARRRSTRREGTAGPEIVIPARRHWIVIVVAPVWLTIWSIAIAGATREVLTGHGRGLGIGFLAVWLAGACLGGGFVLYTWLWNAVGREIVGLRPGLLTVRRDVAGTGRTREYDLLEVRAMRVCPSSPDEAWGASMRCWLGGAGTIAFDYGAKTVRFGDGIDEAEAALVVAELGVGRGLLRPAA